MYRFTNNYVTLTVTEQNDKLVIHGNIIDPDQYKMMELYAPNPIDRMTNYSGSGLPFPNPTIAFENTPNNFQIPTTGEIHTLFTKPNSYYGEVSQKKINPSLFLTLYPKAIMEPIFIHFQMNDELPLKTLYYRPERTGPDFYQSKADIFDVMSQYDILVNTELVKRLGKCA